MAISDYRAAPEVLERLKQVDFVAVVGPTGVGKTTLIKRAVQASAKFHALISDVSREQRPGEQDGVDFHFLPKSMMEARAARGEYATLVVGVTGDLYATAPEEYPTHKTVLMAVLAEAMPMFRALPFNACRCLFIVPPSWEVWQRRLVQHGFTAEQQARRLAEAERSLTFALADEQTLFVINEDITQATEDFMAQALPGPRIARLEAGQVRGRTIAAELLTRLRP